MKSSQIYTPNRANTSLRKDSAWLHAWIQEGISNWIEHAPESLSISFGSAQFTTDVSNEMIGYSYGEKKWHW
jgi:hypothetical protein